MCVYSVSYSLIVWEEVQRRGKGYYFWDQAVSVLKNAVQDIIHNSFAECVLLIQIPFSISAITLQDMPDFEQESPYCLTFEKNVILTTYLF